MDAEKETFDTGTWVSCRITDVSFAPLKFHKYYMPLSEFLAKWFSIRDTLLQISVLVASHPRLSYAQSSDRFLKLSIWLVRLVEVGGVDCVYRGKSRLVGWLLLILTPRK
jgi:hypothetical protein